VSLSALALRWREEAAVLRRRGAESLAAVLEQCAVELADAQAAEASEGLSIADAARASGYSTSQLRRLFPGQNRITRADLPHKGRRMASGAKALIARIVAKRDGQAA